VRVDGELQPFPARYDPTSLGALREAVGRSASVRATLEALGPATIAWSDARALRSVNTPDELAAARAEPA
jgi:molybdopterin-guanine dinucleotide biosynthesis protein A